MSGPRAPIRCERCGATARLITTITSVGKHAGACIYQCPRCQHFVWDDGGRELTGWPAAEPQAERAD